MRQRQQRQESLAKLLSYILSRRPDEFGLVLDETGRLPVKELLWALAQEEGWGYVRRSHLEEVVNLVTPGAFELDKDSYPGPSAWTRQAPVPGIGLAAVPAVPVHHGEISRSGGGAGSAAATGR